MKLVKPEPLIIGDRAHYTLSSYGPVSVEIKVPYITDFDIDLSRRHGPQCWRHHG